MEPIVSLEHADNIVLFVKDANNILGFLLSLSENARNFEMLFSPAKYLMWL